MVTRSTARSQVGVGCILKATVFFAAAVACVCIFAEVSSLNAGLQGRRSVRGTSNGVSATEPGGDVMEAGVDALESDFERQKADDGVEFGVDAAVVAGVDENVDSEDDSEWACTVSPGVDGSLPERCEYGNSLDDGFEYAYNKGYFEACGKVSECRCCKRRQTASTSTLVMKDQALSCFTKHAGLQCPEGIRLYDFSGSAEDCAWACLHNAHCSGFVRVNSGANARETGVCYLRGGVVQPSERHTQDDSDCFVHKAAAKNVGPRQAAKRREEQQEKPVEDFAAGDSQTTQKPRKSAAKKGSSKDRNAPGVDGPAAQTTNPAQRASQALPQEAKAPDASRRKGTADRKTGSRSTSNNPESAAKDLIHVCFCWDDGSNNQPDSLMPLLVAINSTLANTLQGSRLVFHVVTTGSAASATRDTLTRQLPQARIEVHFDDALEQHILSLVTFRKSSGARQSLASAFNFAPFYLDRFLGLDGGESSSNSVNEPAPGNGSSEPAPRKLIYMDTDIVVVGDIRELYDTDLGGHALAAVEDCSQRFEMYIDFKELAAIGLLRKGISKKACVFNRGVFLVDVDRWRDLRLTSEIETYMAAYKQSKKDLYRFGMSQPPWLLAIRGRYKKLGIEWNCRGLGRELLSSKEYKDLSKEGDNEALMGVLEKVGRWPPYYRPYAASCASQARVLHFNGPLKPWMRSRWIKKKKPALCKQRSASAEVAFIDCTQIWKKYMSDETETSLRAALKQPNLQEEP